MWFDNPILKHGLIIGAMAQNRGNKLNKTKVAAASDDSEFLKAFLETTSERLIRALEEPDDQENQAMIYKYYTSDFTMETIPAIGDGL